ncbi:MAG: glycosyltransferase family 39 protein, partial [Candidatus Latescibacteria bacterium]|nr:glycosyltransferase family 39 protein [Candidatus Latescibacterota bacterium]
MPLLPLAADDIRMVDVFSMDEASAVAVVRYLYVTGTWVLETFSYGGLFYYVPVMILYVLGVFGQVDDLMIAVVLRGVGTVAGMGCLFLTFRIGRLVGGEAVGAIAACLLVLTPIFLRWSVEIHPDIPQLFWLLCALYMCCLLVDNRTFSRVAMVGIFAGLAFGTKYSGVFLLPVIGLVILLSRGGGIGQLRNRQVWRDWFLAFGTFSGVCVVTNFSAILHPQTFFHDVEFERAHLSFGHMFQADQAGLTWVVDLVNLMGWAHGIVGIGAVGWLIWSKRLSLAQVMLLAWCVVLVGYLVGFANLRAARHLLPVLPVGLIFVGVGYCEVGRLLKKRGRMLLYTGGVIFGALVLWHRAGDTEGLFVGKWLREEGRAEIAVGGWLGESYGEETSILYHAYAYVPEKFTHAFRASSLHYVMVNHFEPDILVVRDALAGRFANIDDADRAQIGREAFLDRHYFYAYLQAGLIESYVLKKDFGSVAVYQRATAKDSRRVNLGWGDRKERWAQGQALDAIGAFRYMADVHQSRGEVAEASRL